MLKIYAEIYPSQWDTYLDSLNFCYNATPSLNYFTRYEIVFGRVPNFPNVFVNPLDPIPFQVNEHVTKLQKLWNLAKTSITNQQDQWQKTASKSHLPVNYAIGTMVHLYYPPWAKAQYGQSRKFLPHFSGEHKIVRKLNDLTYRVEHNFLLIESISLSFFLSHIIDKPKNISLSERPEAEGQQRKKHLAFKLKIALITFIC